MRELDARTILGGTVKLAERIGDEAYFAALCVRSGMIGLEPPHRTVKLAMAFGRFGMLGGAVASGAIRHPCRAAEDRGAAAPDHPHQRHHRYPQGGPSPRAPFTLADGWPLEQGPVQVRRGDRAVRADVPRTRLLPGRPRDRSRLDARTAPSF